MYNPSYLNIYPIIEKSCLRMSTTIWIYFAGQFFLNLIVNQYISNLSNIYNPDKKFSLASQTICDDMFSDPKSDHIFHIFGYVSGLYIFSSHMYKLSTYFKDEGVGIYCKLIMG